MTVGEIVESLISLRDSNELLSNEDRAICEACNILSKLPCELDSEAAKQELIEIRGHY